MKYRAQFWKNVGFIFAVLLLWAASRFVYARLLGGAKYTGGFAPFDIAFVFLPPLATFFLNWYAMRDQATATITRWSVSWAAVELPLFFLVIYFAGNPLHHFILSLRQ